MLERIKNWIIKVWDKHKDELDTPDKDKIAKLMFNDIFTIIPLLMLSEYNTISVLFYNTRKDVFIIELYCNIYSNKYNSEFQKERVDKEEYKWYLNITVDKNNFSNSCQQLIALREILNSITKKNKHYSQNEINILMKTALENDRINSEKM